MKLWISTYISGTHKEKISLCIVYCMSFTMSISTLDVQSFVKSADLSLKDLQKLRKCDLTAIAQYLDVEITQGLKKVEIFDLLASMELKGETQATDQAQVSHQTPLKLAKLEIEKRANETKV